MSVSVEFPPLGQNGEPHCTMAKGTAGLRTHIGGMQTTVSALMNAGKATGNTRLIKKSIG